MDTKILTVLHTILYFLFLAEGCTNLRLCLQFQPCNPLLLLLLRLAREDSGTLLVLSFFPPPSSPFSVVVIHSDQLLLSFLVVYIGSKKEKFQSGVRLQEKEGKQKIGFLRIPT
jgi:hypothetical protein